VAALSLAARLLLIALVALAALYVWRWYSLERRNAAPRGVRAPGTARTLIGFGTNFFDTLGIGSFAPTTSLFKLLRLVSDEQIPGTLNAGHVVPTLVQALIFIAVVQVDPTTLVTMIAAAVVGARLGAQVVTQLPRRAIQIAMGAALLVAAGLFILANLKLIPAGGDALGLSGGALVIAVAVNFVLGALMTFGIGLYAPCLILVSLLGMNPIAAFPIMMGSCAFLMPVAGMQFIASGRYDLRAALGLLIGGIPGVLLAAFIVKQLPLDGLRWLVAAAILYTSAAMLRSAYVERAETPVGRPTG
jgi:uncharacterized membrane protein YfcA